MKALAILSLMLLVACGKHESAKVKYRPETEPLVLALVSCELRLDAGEPKTPSEMVEFLQLVKRVGEEWRPLNDAGITTIRDNVEIAKFLEAKNAWSKEVGSRNTNLVAMRAALKSAISELRGF